MAKNRQEGLTFKEIQDLGRFTLCEVYKGDKYLYRDTVRKLFPTDKQNKDIIQKQSKFGDNPFISKATGGVKGGAQARFNEAEIIEIRKLFLEGVNNYEIARIYEVAPTTIREIKIGKSYVGVGIGQ